ncbi:response regulator transcription factor, partial [Actinotignum timonense]|uniref:response regulator transcription factor n=1 Tax=Actinotignum timonense TaxID=1870995 RepID=UPI002A8003B8
EMRGDTRRTEQCVSRIQFDVESGLALSGATVKSMAAQLYLSQGTVRNHLSAAIGKTGASTRTEAAQLARARGWI